MTALRTYAGRGLDAVRTLRSGCERTAYLPLRRNLLASMEAWRRSLSSAAEVTFGPEIAFDESGGALGALDRAMTTNDCEAVQKQAYQIERALQLADAELARRGIAQRAQAQALSDGAYDLGQAIFESTAFVPEGDDAALADVLGLIDGVESGARTLGVDLSGPLAPFARVRSVRTLAEVKDRASLVRATGVLGAMLRAKLRERGLAAYPRFPVRTATDEVSAFTLPRPAAPADPEPAALGEKLFFDPRLSRGRARSCASCHDPARAYADGLVAPASLEVGTLLRRNTPSLFYAPLAALLTWDGRVRTADRQALTVIHTRAEMGLGEEELTHMIQEDPALTKGLRRAFGEGATAQQVGLALSAFEARAMVPDSAPVDRFGRGQEVALSDDARAGLDVFAGKGRCARCHVPPVFGGSRPPDFTAPVFAVLGVPSAPGAPVLDDDPGREAITHRPEDYGSFKVPSVRNAGRTAPYFHHGRYPTLEQVIDFYDIGGGNGLGLAVKNQDPEVRPLHLSPEERRTLLVFLRDALDDTQ
jgi:cytochrome c peroxidase